MKKPRRAIGTGLGLAALASYLATVCVTPAHLLEEQHHFLSDPAEHARAAADDPDHGHHHGDPSHDPHAASDHELVAVCSHHAPSFELIVLDVKIDRPVHPAESEEWRIPTPQANDPPDQYPPVSLSSRAPPLL